MPLAAVLIWKGKDKASFDKVEGVYVTYQKKAWVDSNLLKRWIDMQFPLVNVSDGKYLVWDSMRAHVSKEVKAKCNMRGIKMCVIPGGLTPYLQAGGIGIYRYFKDILYAEITAWKESDQVTYTKADNPRPPPVTTTKYSATLTTAPESEEPADQVIEDSVFNVDEMHDALDEVSVVIDE
ncbi:hypothetical protein ATCC90586_010231 [Pythium insidiosum]|nr:hypothetical protein ATCC90586_010231 [Pythium insidiosum]